MQDNFHSGKIMSRREFSNADIQIFRSGNYKSAMESIGKKHPSRLFIREWMKDRGVKSTRLAERMEHAEGTVSKLLNGHMEMTTTWLGRFADALDVSVPQLFVDPKMPTQNELLAMASPEELRQAIRLIQMARTGTDS